MQADKAKSKMEESFDELASAVAKAMKDIGGIFPSWQDIIPDPDPEDDEEYELDDRLRKAYDHPE